MFENLESYLHNLLGSEYDLFAQAGAEPAAIRVNTLKSDVQTIKNEMSRFGVNLIEHGICPEGFLLEQDKLPLSQTLFFFLGEIFYQGFSSQLPVIALDPRPGERVLDMTAAPGNKSTQIAARMQNKGELVLNDASVNRQQPLLTNLYRAGVFNDLLLNFPGQRIGKIYPEYFDKVLVDAPCSGTGRMPTNKKFLYRPYPDSLSKMLNTQRHLLISAIKAAKPGGTIVYSTCTVIMEENEQHIKKVLKDYPVELVEINGWDHPNLRNAYSIDSQIANKCKNFEI